MIRRREDKGGRGRRRATMKERFERRKRIEQEER